MKKNTNKSQEVQPIDLMKILLVSLHRWWWFAIALAFCLGVAFIHLQRQTSKYSVAGSIMIRNDEGKSPMFQSEMLDLMGYSGYKAIIDEIEILHSYAIMEQVVKALNLQTSYRKKVGLRWVGQYPTPDIAVTYPAGFLDTLRMGVSIYIERSSEAYKITVNYNDLESEHTLTSLSEAVKTCAGPITFMEIHPLEPGEKMRISTSPVPAATDRWRAAVSCDAQNIKQGSNIITLSCVTDVPKLAIDVISKMIELYNLDAVIDKNIMASNTANFINDRLNIITLELDTVERAVESYMKENGLSDIDQELRLALTTKEAYQRQQADYEIQINLLNYIQEYLQDPKNDHNLIPGNLGVNDASLTALLHEYNELLLNRMRIARSANEDNPKLTQLDQQLVQLRKGIIAAIKNNKEGLTISKNDVIRKDDHYNALIRQMPAKERRYMEIKRQQEIKEKLFIYLYEKREENALTLASTVMPAKLVDAPRVSGLPVAPRRSLTYLIALIMGMGVPFAIILIIGYIDHRIQDRKEFLSVVKAPFLGELLVNKTPQNNIVVNDTSNTVSAEMFRTIRTNMKFMLPDVKCPVVLVTSALNGEGKSFVAVNTAASFALLGKKVLLLGLDIRKPTLSKYLGITFQGAVTSYLLGEDVSEDELVIKSGYVENLDIAPSGIVPPNPAELIQSPRLKMLFDKFRSRYDLIIVDSAPVTLVSDTIHIAPLVDMTIFVTRANYTAREMLPFIQELYEQNRLPNMACVLNGIQAEKAYGHYGYGLAYGYGHYGYGTYVHQ